MKLQSISEHAKNLPIFWGHGESDQTVRFKFATMSKEYLTATLSIRETSEPGSAGLSFNKYKGLGHSADIEELDDLKKWLKNVIPK
jgi:predicted esterase